MENFTSNFITSRTGRRECQKILHLNHAESALHIEAMGRVSKNLFLKTESALTGLAQ